MKHLYQMNTDMVIGCADESSVQAIRGRQVSEYEVKGLLCQHCLQTGCEHWSGNNMSGGWLRAMNKDLLRYPIVE